MFSTLYIEEEVQASPRTQAIIERLSGVPVVQIERYGELFNRSNQNFRLQKQAPALILAKKYGNLVLPTPPGYGFEHGTGAQGFYFSHMLNCVYDCRYCFLQGMFRSANMVLFVNYEDFQQAITTRIADIAANLNLNGGQANTTQVVNGEAGNGNAANRKADNREKTVFYSGYDCDSLALEPLSRFIEYFLPVFEQHSEAVLEIRTKSTQVRHLLERTPLPNCVIAMSFSPSRQSKAYEHKVPGIDKRLEALQNLQQAGWPIALRFEPVIAEQGILAEYQQLFANVFSRLDAQRIHSISLGEYRMPRSFHKRIERLYPDEPLLAREVRNEAGMTVLAASREGLLAEIETMLLNHVDATRYYRCA